MWNKIKLIFNKDEGDISKYTVSSIPEEYAGVNFTFNSCPNCDNKFESIPKRKKKCPECNAYIFVRTNYDLNRKILLSEKGVEQLEANRSNIGFIKKWIGKLGEYGISEKVYYKRYKKASEKKGFILKHSDFIWAMFNKLASDIKEPFKLKMLYYDMAWYLNEEEKDFFEMLKESKKWELLDFKQSDHVKRVEILAANSACEPCKKQEGKIFIISEALKKMPIPCKECTNSDTFCRCSYVPVIE